MMNRRSIFAAAKEALQVGAALVMPLNHYLTFTDYIDPMERIVACPNQDVVYGASYLALDQSPAVVQVPDFGGRFFVYQVVDSRTDSFAQIGSMYATQPGFYLLVGPGWEGAVPKGISRVFRSTTYSGFLVARTFLNDTDEDRAAVQPLINQINVYPLTDFDGKMKVTDWKKIKKIPGEKPGKEETNWVPVETFLDVLPKALADAPPLPGEEARYAQVLQVLETLKG